MPLFGDSTFKLETQTNKSPYIPMHVVRKEDLSIPTKGPFPLVEGPGVTTFNGRLPGALGHVLIGSEEWSLDFVSAEGDGTSVCFTPTGKDAVKMKNPDDTVGIISADGLSVLTSDAGKFIITAAHTSNIWLAEAATAEGARVSETDGIYNVQFDFPLRGTILHTIESGEMEGSWARPLPS